MGLKKIYIVVSLMLLIVLTGCGIGDDANKEVFGENKIASLNPVENNKNEEILVPVNCIDNLTQEGVDELNRVLKRTFSIEGWCSLTVLDLRDKQLKILPKELGGLSNLGFLYLGRNQLTTLPSELKNLTNLVLLDVWKNQFTEFPHVIGELKGLTVLGLSHNQLSILPQEIQNLKNLDFLYLEGNSGLFPLDKSFGFKFENDATQGGMRIRYNEEVGKVEISIID
ncbi:leucine-rich repeat domain-containing protein [Candidatus Gracilibacteria bacterium 28_42_T64]|nr:leucine-rich repeat domain-containing protein [Candidatus Gracilibacteria bacterium 28_42_T64]